MMELSPEILTEFGLNMAGYIVVGILVYVLTRTRRRRIARAVDTRVAETPPPASPAAPPQRQPQPQAVAEQPEFMSLFSEDASTRRTVPVATVEAPRNEAPVEYTPDTRRENRRAIYREARRLLATGKSERELLDRLPLTEDELEMLSVAGRA